MEQEEPSKKQLRFFEKFKKKAQQIVNDNAALRSTLVKAQEKLAASDSDEGLKGKLVEYVKLVLRMLTNTINGNYKGLPWQTLVMIVAGLLYFIAPLDALPDFIPVAGLVDDATILVWLGKCFQDDLNNYKKWEEVNFSD
ncbi:uncharacterized protein DUF1232 [Roseivirga pacifica]|jgi:uncharacterized membrane protein YkvA (DUF1232 family)|uniref:DUF1232 domain-containing protein n=1 Tax=Roseivirga pacifica TaxID=1267423 RepID=A0A1I0P1P2_9BACT|nr:YkvA family protein [Roseivirga pacifica]RKQ51631.1 uncharacterized protein DUF1232 [Roseivirga pacifica]SEW07975.1 Protein of unknown function [Roseivirga pacifica]